MSGYRFCRTDDIALLVDALNHCWAPHFPDEPLTTAATFKRSIRDLQVWCSSCMVAFAGSEPIGVLIGAKRPWGTLVHKIAVHPDHARQGHGRHLLTSLGSKLAILGPPRIVAEVPGTLGSACELFRSAGFVEEGSLTDYVWESEGEDDRGRTSRLIIPITIDDLAANGLLDAAQTQACWQRCPETLSARKGELAGLAVATDERIEAYILYLKDGEIVALRSLIDDGWARIRELLLVAQAGGTASFRIARTHPAEMPANCLETIGFRAADGYRLYAATARSN